jgi:hypothetical protein
MRSFAENLDIRTPSSADADVAATLRVFKMTGYRDDTTLGKSL